ncbi:Autoinducer 2 sensor kinase/phosphatase LuxQ [Planctomycetes bacterium Poly30]|uniref:histidine kinase n=1 Tax=Saltatorellus ferox TaxID=2528018 RepID=A0A518ELQ5_9BACT|nr:Autoinducer 2 sensor kinase/phosphatase LuxQ [Planctomycetes bacterium Poly30]
MLSSHAPTTTLREIDRARRAKCTVDFKQIPGIQDSVNRDLANGVFGGSFAYVGAWLAIAFVTKIHVDHPQLFWTMLGAFVALGGLRLRLIHRFRKGLEPDGRSWRLRLSAQLTLAGLLWSVATATLGVADSHSLGFSGAIYGLVTMAGIGSATMAPSLRLALSYVTALVAPTAVALILQPEPHATANGMGLAVILCFVVGFTRHMHRNYALQIVTNHVLAEQTEDLLRTQSELHREERAREMFFAAVSHELRTPLHGIIGMVNELGESELSSEQQDSLEVIRNSGDQMLGVIGDILDLAKARQGELSLELVPLDLVVLGREVVSMIGHTASAKGLRFDLDARVHEATVIGDPLRIRQVLLNLASNAIKFTQGGSVTIVVESIPRESVGRTWFRLSVRDTGSGMDAQTLEHVFKPFHQASASTQREHGGTGLGLSIVAQLVERMGGELRAESEVGVGSSFVVEIPFEVPAARNAAEDANSQAAKSASAKAKLFEGSGIRVLAADDQVVNRRVLQRMLERIGLEGTLVEDGAQAVEAFRKGAYDLILLDCQMPVMDGYEATRSIRALDVHGAADVPILALSGSAGDEIGDVARAAGMNACLLKPITQDELVSALHEHLPGRFFAPHEPAVALEEAA